VSTAWDSLVRCDLCEEWWCTECEVHWFECSCPGPHDDETGDTDGD